MASRSTWSAPGAFTTFSRNVTAAGRSCAASRFTKRTASIRSITAPNCCSTKSTRQTFPEGYRYLAYLQTKLGFKIKMDMPQLKGPVVQALYAHGHAWLEGTTSAFPN